MNEIEFGILDLATLTRNLRLRSGVMKPFFPFFARAASSRRARTSAFLRSFSAALRFSSCQANKRNGQD